jgi:hypothetical protein
MGGVSVGVGDGIIDAADLGEDQSDVADMEVKQATGEPSEVKPDMQPTEDEEV